MVGSVYSGAFSQTFGTAAGLCMLKPKMGATRASVAEGTYTVLVEGKEIPATVSLRGSYDPRSERLLS